MIVPIWAVIWPYDPEAVPPKPKLWVSVAPSAGLFLRINSKSRPHSVALPKTLHPFLDRDSWLHCGGMPIACDAYRLAELMGRQRMPERRGILGVIAPEVRPEVIAVLRTVPTLPEVLRRTILAELEPA